MNYKISFEAPHRFDFKPPKSVPFIKAVRILRSIDEYHARGDGFKDYRQFVVCEWDMSISTVKLQCAMKHEAHLKSALASYLLKNA